MMSFYHGVLLSLLIVGALAGAGFLASHRPRRWRRLAAIDASGWVLLVTLWYARSIVLVIIRWRDLPAPGPWDATFALATLAAFDVLLIVRLLSFHSFAERDRRALQDADAK